MKRFCALVEALSDAREVSMQSELLAAYFRRTDAPDAAWALRLLLQRKSKRLVDFGRMRSAALAASGLDTWLFAECQSAVGDMAETIALILPAPEGTSSLSQGLARFIEESVLTLERLDAETQARALCKTWSRLDYLERLVFSKLVLGTFRGPTGTDAVVEAVSSAFGTPTVLVRRRRFDEGAACAEWFEGVVALDGDTPDRSEGQKEAARLESVQAVLMYVERGTGMHYWSYTQLTAGVWKGEELVPIAKVGGGLSKEEIAFIEAFVDESTVERFGPVVSVKPGVVIEIEFEGVEPAVRRKAGIALRSPRIVRLCRDAGPESAARLDTLTALVEII